jgi:hypothetical protein
MGTGDLQNSFSVRLVQMFAGRQVCVFFKMLRPQRFGNGVLAAEPFAEVNQLAAMRTKRAVSPGKPVATFLAGGTSDLHRAAHRRDSVADSRNDGFHLASCTGGFAAFCPGNLKNRLHVGNVGIGLKLGNFRAIDDGFQVLGEAQFLR